MTGLAVAALGALLLGGWVVWVYRTRELPIAGRGRLAALRVATLGVILLLLADPTLPVGEAGGPARAWWIVDGSLSMGVAGPSGVPWERARAEAAGAAEDARVAVFGDSTALGTEAELAAAPGGHESRLAPILRRAAESGAREVTVVSDLRISDVPEVAGLRDELGLDVRFVDVGEPLRSAGIAAVSVPATGRAGDPVEVGVELFGTASAEGAEARVELLRNGEPAGEGSVRLPGPGRTVSLALPAALPDSAGPVLWRARVRIDGDAFEADDVRSAFTEVDPLEGLLALVSLTPDWEPRFLLPVLARVTGLPARGWLSVGEDAWLPMDGAGGTLDDGALARVADDARVLVVHGFTGRAPEWLAAAQARGRRVLVFARDAGGAARAGVEAGPPRPGEWYGAAAAGPLAGAMAAVPWAELPPLSSPLTVDSTVAAPLELERPGGERAPALLLQDRGDRRRAVVLARDFWRWGFRSEAGADAYDRLWSGVAGWLLAVEEGAPGGGVGPAERVTASGRPVEWWAPVAAGGTVAVTTTDSAGGARTDTVPVGTDGRARLPALAVGGYRWAARVVAPDSLAEAGRVWEGRVEVEAHTDEFRWPRDTTLAAWRGGGEAGADAPSGRPLRTSPWPYLLILVLLSTEWILRRRAGLR